MTTKPKSLREMKALLESQAKRGLSETRYRVSGYSLEELSEMVMLCYEREVSERGAEMRDIDAVSAKAKRVANFLMNGKPAGLLLYGSVGSGKTTMAKAVRRLVGLLETSWRLSERKSFCQISALDYSNKVLNNTQDSCLRAIKEHDMLILDDLGIEPSVVKVYGNEISPITDLLFHRYDNNLLTIITSNLSDEEISQKYGPRIADRMEEMFFRISYQEKSYRRKSN